MILPKVHWDTRRRMPCFWFFNMSYAPWAFLRVLIRIWRYKDFSVVSDDGIDTLVVSYRGMRLHISYEYALNFFYEWKDFSSDYIIEGFSLKDKVVLDVGAGCGETALFFLSHGAKKVVCIEKDHKCFDLLKKNLQDGLRIEAINESFKLDHLRQFRFDFAKIDIEGGESELLKLDKINFPLAIEIHGKEMFFRFHKKFCELKTLKAWRNETNQLVFICQQQK
jgi:hypothetical protein